MISTYRNETPYPFCPGCGHGLAHKYLAEAIAELGVKSGFETTLVRPKGPQSPPPVAGVAPRLSNACDYPDNTVDRHTG